VDILVSQPATTVAFSPESMERLSLATRHLFDKAFIGVLVRGCTPPTSPWPTRDASSSGCGHRNWPPCVHG
jgi:hypothetical protein